MGWGWGDVARARCVGRAKPSGSLVIYTLRRFRGQILSLPITYDGKPEGVKGLVSHKVLCVGISKIARNLIGAVGIV